MKTSHKLLYILFTVITLLLVSCSFSAEKSEEEVNDQIVTWVNWKVNHISDPEKKEVVEYLKTINTIFSPANETRFVTDESDYGMPNPRKAIKIIVESLEKIRGLDIPNGCTRYQELTVKTLEAIKAYQEGRVELGDSEEFFQRFQQDIFEHLKLEAERQGEYIAILRSIGFYDNMEEEMYDLGLITESEKLELMREREELKLEKIGAFYPGMSLEEVRKILGPEESSVKEVDSPWFIHYGNDWLFIVDPDTKIVNQITFSSREPKQLATLRGITIGSTDKDIFTAYGEPSKILFRKGGISQNTFLPQKYLFYDNYNMAIFLVIATPGEDEWRAANIILCTPEGYKYLKSGVPAYAEERK